MKTILSLSCALIFTEAVFAQSPSATAKPAAQAARAATVNASDRIARAGNGREYLVNEVKVTLRAEFARELQQTAGAGQPLNPEWMRRLHPAIESVKAGHTAGHSFLGGEALPMTIRLKDGQVPRLARMLTFVLKPGFDAAQVAPELRALPELESASLSELYPVTLVPNDTYYTNQWAPARIGLTDAWDVPSRGSIRVAIVDTGVDLQHPDFAGRIVVQRGDYGEFPTGDAPTDGRNDFDHGTHVAGIVAAGLNNGIGVAGFGNQIQLMVYNCAQWSSSSDKYLIANADDAINQALTDGARVVNCSFGSPGDINSSLNAVIDDAYNRDVLVVVAAGNRTNDMSGPNGTYWNQSAVPFIISATRSDDTFEASYSNFGARIDLSAPGTSIYSTVPLNSTPPYGNKNGTSMATPMVSGAAALVVSMNPTLIEDHSAKDILIRMATDLGAPGRDPYFGWGRLFVSAPTLRALRAADAFVTSVPNPFGQNGRYDMPWLGLPAALANVANDAVLVLNGGVVAQSTYRYPAITISKPCTLSAIPDRPIVIGQ